MSGIRDILYVRFSVSDIRKQETFLTEFGFEVQKVDIGKSEIKSSDDKSSDDKGNGDLLIARGTDPSTYVYIAEQGEDAFLGLGFEAESIEDLNRIAAIDSVPVEEISDLPGGGLRARLTDPDGFTVDVVFGISHPDPLEVPARNSVNTGEVRPRVGERVVLPANAQIVKRLGHCVINVTDFRTSEAWYKERIGFITSDEIFIGDESNTLGAFFRLNRGEQYVDHHTMFVVGAGQPEFNHAAFEVADWDTLMLGHARLTAGEYEHKWGVGKHLLGSQVFDYWKDPHSFTLEHFTDGDLFNVSFGSHKQPIETLMGVHWGPEGMP